MGTVAHSATRARAEASIGALHAAAGRREP
jgi:hypothetical protein